MDEPSKLVDTVMNMFTRSAEADLKTIYIDFVEGDGRDPKQFSKKKKWVITGAACVFSFLGAMDGSSYALGFPSMEAYLNCTPFQAAIGLSAYCAGFGVLPLLSSPFSEDFGRQPLYVLSVVGFSLTHVMTAFCNVQTVILARLLGGAFASTSSTMVGGTIADIWSPEERGLPMSIFSGLVMSSVGVGALMAGWIEQNPHLKWRWIQWISLILSGVCLLTVPLLMEETRSSVILVRLAKKVRKETGDQRYRTRVEDELPSLRKLILTSCTRALQLVLTEPTVASFSLWAGFVWGVLYALIESIGPVFSKLHNFNSAQVGSVYMSLTVGSLLGCLINVYQEKIYLRTVATRGPEARLGVVCFTAWLIPIGMFIYAWTAFSFVHWKAPAIGIALFMWGLFSVFSVAVVYLAYVYGPYASSAIAGQSLSRNMMGTAFPLFTQQMLNKLG